MALLTLPASPNWYISHTVGFNKSGLLVFAARHDVFIYDASTFPIAHKGVYCGHREKVTCVTLPSTAVDPNQMLCCSGSEDGKVFIWDVNSYELLYETEAHSKVTALTWSASNHMLIVFGDDKGEVTCWNFCDNRIASFKGEKSPVLTTEFSNLEEFTLAVGYKSGVVILYDIRDGSLIHRLRGHDDEVHSIAWCPIPGENFKPQKTYKDLDRPEEENETNVNETERSNDFGEEGHLLASASKDRTIRIWSTVKGRQLASMRLPKTGGPPGDSGRSKLWAAIVWSYSDPHNIVSSSFGGDLLLWDLAATGQQKWQPFSATDKRQQHNRIIFNLRLGFTDNNLMATTSMDRQLIIWDVKKRRPVHCQPTLGGYVYCARTSPIDPGRIALGVGDNMIRVWNLNNSNNPFDVVTLWQGIRSKVTALCWHPKKEGLLAYGTDDGRVGVYDTLANKPPSVSSNYHKRTVYVVSWGPQCIKTEGTSSAAYFLYSIGDGVVMQHDPYKLEDEAHDLNKLIEQSNGRKPRVPVRSEISWSPDFSVVAIGNDDGSIEILDLPDLKLRGTVHVHKKLINAIVWHPQYTTTSSAGSPYNNLIATGSNESSINIIDLKPILADKDGKELLIITEPWKSLRGHCHRITGLSWSTHCDGFIASSSYDGQAMVWSIETEQMLACYRGHKGRLLTVQWSGQEKDVVFTGGEDFSFHKWRLTDHLPSETNVVRKKRVKTRAGKNKKATDGATEQEDAENVMVKENGLDLNADEKESMEALIKSKKQLLQKQEVDEKGDNSQCSVYNDEEVLKSTSSPKADDSTGSEVTSVSKEASSPNCTKATEVQPEFTKIKERKVLKPYSQTHGKEPKKKPWKPKSFFPLSGRKEARGKEPVLNDILILAKHIFGKFIPEEVNDVEGEDCAHLGFFLDRKAMYRCLNLEGQYHRENDNMDYFYQLEIWKGNITGALRIAREREELSDWLVAMAPMASFESWVTVCTDYAIQLELEGQYHKAVSYLLAAHKVYDAIDLFKKHRLFKEAIALAKVRLSPFDPVLEDLYTLWAHQLTKDGNYEQAAKCHLAMRQVQDAANLLARRYNQPSLRTASHVCMIAKDKQQGLVYAQKVVQQYLIQNQWKEAYSFLKEDKHLQLLSAVTAMHELLAVEITKCGDDLLTIEKDNLTDWSEKLQVTPILPDFILDSDENDPISPWQPNIVEGHTFPHHVLRIWYGNLGITMDTNSLEEMYKSLSVLHAGRQAQTELPQLLVQISIDLVLCLLSLLMSETPMAISHLLKAVSSLHEANHLQVMEILLKLFLPQGPKYMLKLQQEITAMRVVISMENNIDFDTSKMHTIKRYMSELKDEDSVSNGGLRCRELDCLRAYYFVAILNYLRKNLGKKEDEQNESESSKLEIKNESKSDVKGDDKIDSVENIQGIGECENNNSKTEEISNTKSEKENSEASIQLGSKKLPSTSDSSVSALASSFDTSISLSGQLESIKSSDIEENLAEKVKFYVKCDDDMNPVAESADQSLVSGKGARPKTFRFLSFETPEYRLSVSKLSHVARGLLWDIQGKRYALTETLGYIYKGISQLLLDLKPSSISPSPSQAEVNSQTMAENLPLDHQAIPMSYPEVSGESVSARSSVSSLIDFQGSAMGKKRHSSEPVIQKLQPHETLDMCHRSASTGSQPSLEAMSLQYSSIDKDLIEDPDLYMSSDWLIKSRKVLWEDEPHHPLAIVHSGKENLTSIINPNKYINVPDEWYNMPADQKYTMKYVTMAILKEEQEYMMQELKNGPDAIQTPFPNPMDSVKLLLVMCGKSDSLTENERHMFAEKIVTWAMKYAVSSQQKDSIIDHMHQALTHL
ncbi:gem-associated protein 5-like isoform X2 [Mytilus galloprovincialis]|uniref:gem-associated protein 5-like isoform X2 n=1 Tax=Mytilus galloprovincialis TaxID=29158 RepID=UPI003F7C3D87